MCVLGSLETLDSFKPHFYANIGLTTLDFVAYE